MNDISNLGHYTVPEDTKNGICIDVGCNVGDFTFTYRDHFAHIYFIEPQIKLFEHNIKRFEGNEKITGLNRAAWSQSNILLKLLNHKNHDSGSVGVNSSLLNDEWLNEVVNEILSISLADVINMYKIDVIDYLKVDCETSEYEFLINSDLSKIRYIGIELHHQMGFDRYNELLKKIHYTHTHIAGNIHYTSGANQEALFKIT